MVRFRTLLVPVDFSRHSGRALGVAIELAREFGAEIHLLHAYELPVGPALAYGIPLPQDLDEEMRDAAARRLEKALHRVEEAGLRGETHLVQSTPAEAIAQLARELPADLIVMGTRGLAGLKHVLLGSVAERVLRLAPCPVLTVKEESVPSNGPED